jgi:hypothetical protein
MENIKTEVSVQNIVDDKNTDIADSTRSFINNLFQAGMSLVDIPINILPRKSRKHLQEARREITLGVAALTRELADVIVDSMPDNKD